MKMEDFGQYPVGASIARPPKIGSFRIFTKKDGIFALRRQILHRQNLRTTDGRPYTAFYASDYAF